MPEAPLTTSDPTRLAHVPVRADVARLSPYQLPDLPAEVATLALNESFRPPSPAVGRALAGEAARLMLYPDADWQRLASALAAHHGVERGRILVGAGSIELIGVTLRAFAAAGDEVLKTAHGYAFFETAAKMAGARVVAVAEPGRTVSVDALLAGVSPATRVVCLANPGNPTGTHIPNAEIRRLRAGLPSDVLLIIDEAYGEFADAHGDGPLYDLTDQGNTIVLRTFSKAYGLAGARVGWGVFPPAVAAELRKLLTPNNVTSLSQAAALAALGDQSYLHETCRLTRAGLEGFRAAIADLPIGVGPSVTNFLLLDFGDPARAGRANAALGRAGAPMRQMGLYGLGGCLRATCGTPTMMETAARALRVWAKEEEGS